MKINYPRIFDARKPDGFKPAVQRWSVLFPEHCQAVHVAFFAVQARGESDMRESGFFEWADAAMQGKYAPASIDHSSFTDDAGSNNRVVTAYWIDSGSFNAWQIEQRRDGWWESGSRESGKCGFWREMLTVPVDRVETIYWEDYRANLGAILPVEPTPYCGYFGAMRDRIPLAACDRLETDATDALSRPSSDQRIGARRWFVHPPHNLAMIRSASFWGNCDDEQKADYDEKLRDPLARGMDFLRTNPIETGCCSLRFLQTLDLEQKPVPETHAYGYFLSLEHMEGWAEGHASHKAIFDAAIARYSKYGPSNQLRTWHEVYVLPSYGQHFEYINCHNRTGILPWFKATALDRKESCAALDAVE
ncbi:phenylacetaldoxime dehydratase family protein [Paraburkholderia sp. GAS42]|uniref:phenylacetaldoxime dehydratase family protein n=1 Tax=Paraburkholderia sp. GAS42 TaxID=3035135 RepID=UPI003D1D217C